MWKLRTWPKYQLSYFYDSPVAFFPVSLFISWLVLSIFEFVVSTKLGFRLEYEVENHMRPNYIITLTEIKKTKGGERFKRSLKIWSCSWSKEEEKLLRQMKLWQGGLICIYVPRFYENIFIVQLYKIFLFPFCIWIACLKQTWCSRGCSANASVLLNLDNLWM